jgi:LPXTG-motif cell wall-anchored protein
MILYPEEDDFVKRLLAIIFSLSLVFSLSPLHNIVKAEEQTATTTIKTTEQPTTTKTPEVTPPATDETKEQTKEQGDTTTPTTEDKGTTNGQTGGQQPPATNNPNSNEDNTPVSDVKMEVHRQLSETGYKITAKLKDVTTSVGTWTFVVDDKKVSTVSNKKTSASYNLSVVDDLENGQEMKGYDIKVVFEGKADGKDVKVQQTHSIPDLKFDYAQVGEKDKFTGTLIPGKEAVGDWAIFVSDKNGEEVIDEASVENYKGTSFTHTFSALGKGTYLVGIVFFGKVDGEDTAIIKYITLEITKEGNGGEIKPPPTDYKPTKPVDKDTVKDIIKDTKKGGPLPKTATSNPTGMVAGATLLVLGVVLLSYRRFANQQ